MLNQQHHQGNLEGCGRNLMMPNNKEAQLNMKPCAILGMYCVNKLSLDVMTWCGVWGRGQRGSKKVNTRGAAVAKGSSSELTHKGSLFHQWFISILISYYDKVKNYVLAIVESEMGQLMPYNPIYCTKVMQRHPLERLHKHLMNFTPSRNSEHCNVKTSELDI